MRGSRLLPKVSLPLPERDTSIILWYSSVRSDERHSHDQAIRMGGPHGYATRREARSRAKSGAQDKDPQRLLRPVQVGIRE